MRTGCSGKANLLKRAAKQQGAHLRPRDGEVKESFGLNLVRVECSLDLGLLGLEFYSVHTLEGLIVFQWKYILLSKKGKLEKSRYIGDVLPCASLILICTVRSIILCWLE